MKSINIITLLLIIIGGVNWGLFGAMNIDLVAAIFGAGSMPARVVYMLVGVSALYQLIPFTKALGADEVSAQASVASRH